MLNALLMAKEYLKSLQDGREIYIYGERKDVTTHPAFRNSAASIGQLYDALHDKTTHDQRWNTDTGNGGHKFFRFAKVPMNYANSVTLSQIGHVRATDGWDAPDYKAAFASCLGANPEYYGQFADNARHWYKRIQESGCTLTMPLLTHQSTVTSQLMKLKMLISNSKETDGDYRQWC